MWEFVQIYQLPYNLLMGCTQTLKNILTHRLTQTHTWSDNKVRKLIMVKILHTTLMPAPSAPFKTILELVLWNGLQSCHHITPDVISVIRMPSF
jgi:hypothetical protein